MSEEDTLNLDNIKIVRREPSVRKKGDTTGTLYHPKSLTEVRQRASEAGKIFFSVFGQKSREIAN